MSITDFERRVIEVEDDLRIVFLPHKGQKAILYALLFKMLTLVFMQCGRKFGKTDTIIYCLYWFAMVFDGCEVYYIADTMKHARELVWDNRRLPDFFKKIKKRRGESKHDFEYRKRKALEKYDKWILKSNDSTMKIFLRNGSIINVDGAENYANADGLEPQFVGYDEFKHHDRRYNEAMEPNLDVYNGSMLIIGTPPESKDTYYCEVANDSKRRSDAAFFCCPSHMNEYMYPNGEEDPKFQKIIKKYINRGDWHILQREYYAKIVSGGSSHIFPMFEPRPIDEFGEVVGYSKHIWNHDMLIKDIKNNTGEWEFYCSFDPGTAKCFAVLFAALHIKTNAMVFLDEIYEKNMKKTSTKQIFPRAFKIMMDICEDIDAWTIVYDYAAAWFYNEVQVEYGVSMMPCTKDLKDKENKLSLIKDAMLSDLWVSSEKCTNLHFEIENYIKDKNGNIPKDNDHLIDDMRYIYNASGYDFTLLPDTDIIDDDDKINVKAHIDVQNLQSFNIGYEDVLDEYYD